MKLIKKINNNYAIALDSKGKQIIVEGKGVGFIKMPCELEDLSIIRRTYYNAKKQDVHLIESISQELLLVCEKIYDYAMRIVGDRLNPNLPFILADHIQFCIERLEKNIQMKIPLYYDVEYLYPSETKIAEYALKTVLVDLGILLPDYEKTGIALNIINSELQTDMEDGDYSELIRLCTAVVEKSMDIKIRKNGFEYSRFVTHMEYFFRRGKKQLLAVTNNTEIYEKVTEEYPKVKQCVDTIETVLNRKGFKLNQEEKLYIMLHVNRLCTREDCNR